MGTLPASGYEIRWASWSEEIEQKRMTGSVEIQCLKKNRVAVETGLIGASWSDRPNLVCNRIVWTPLGDWTTSNSEGDFGAIGKMNFIPSGEYNKDKLGYVTTSWSIMGESFTLGKGCKWLSDSKEVNQDISALKRIVIADITYSYRSATFPSTATTLVEKINWSGVTDTNGFTYAAYTLYFPGIQIDVSSDDDGAKVYNIRENFKWRPQTWKNFWREDKPGGAGWDTLLSKDGTAIYESGNFGSL